MRYQKNRTRTAWRALAATVAPIGLVSILSACDLGSSGIVNPEAFEFRAGRGGVPGGPGGGGGSATVELAMGLTTSGPQDVLISSDNDDRLVLDTPGEDSEMFAGAFTLTATHAAGLGACQQRGVFDQGLSPGDILDLLLDPEQFRDFTLYIDKSDAAAGVASDYNQIRQNWAADIPSGRVVTFIGFKNKKARLPGVSDPIVTATDLGGGTTLYTFQAGTGIVGVTQLSGAPKEQPNILCPLLDDVEVRVTITP